MKRSCSGVDARASRIDAPVEPGGATTTHRLFCAGWFVSSTSVKPSVAVKKAMASS